MYRFFYIITFLLFKLVFPTKRVGVKNISKKQNYIFLCNHRSNSDAVILFNNIFHKQRFLAKKELFIKRGFLRCTLNALKAIPIDRENLDLTAIKTCLKALSNKESLTIFPEGTRADSQNDIEVKNGASMFAIKTQTPIVPLYIDRKPKAFRRTKLFVGKPFELSEFYGQKATKDVLEKASDIVELNINALRKP